MNKYKIYLKNGSKFKIIADEWKDTGTHIIFIKGEEEVARVNWQAFAALKREEGYTITKGKITQYEGLLDWKFTYEKPSMGSRVIFENLHGAMFIVTIDDTFVEWGDNVVIWAYLDEMEVEDV